MLVLISDSLIDSVLKRWGQNSDHEPFLNKTVIWCPAESLEKSSVELERQLIGIRGQLTVVAHGRSGLVALHTLIRSPQLRSRVKKLMLVQSPVWGTPLADFLTGHSIVRWLTQAMCFVVRLPIAAIEEMSEFNRQVYMILHRPAITELMNSCEVVTVGTTFEWKAKPEGWLQKLLHYFNGLIAKHSGPNDGWVPEKSTRIAGETHHLIEQVTHLGSIKTLQSSSVSNEKTMILKLSEYPKKFLLVQSEVRNAEEPARL